MSKTIYKNDKEIVGKHVTDKNDDESNITQKS